MSDVPPPRAPALRWLLLAVTLALAWVLWPFAAAILWAGVLALVFSPWHAWLLNRLGGRRSLAALLSVLLILAVVMLPLLLLAAALANEATQLYGRVQSGELAPTQYFREAFAALPQWLRGLLRRAGVVDFPMLQRQLSALLLQALAFLGTQAGAIGQNTLQLVLWLFITPYLAFYLLRDGQALVLRLRLAAPLAPVHMQQLADTFATAVRATVRGNFVVALVQGVLGGLALWVLGVEAVLLWTALMVLLSLLPAVGASLVWLPVAVYLFVTGSVWSAAALAGWGVLVVGLADNVLRPRLVGRGTRLPDWLVLLSTLGGLAVMGLSGFVLGPVVAALFIAAWQIHRGQADDALVAPQAEGAAPGD